MRLHGGQGITGRGVGEATLQHMENVHPLYLSQSTQGGHLLASLSFTHIVAVSLICKYAAGYTTRFAAKHIQLQCAGFIFEFTDIWRKGLL